jgi:hypothetical protein
MMNASFVAFMPVKSKNEEISRFPELDCSRRSAEFFF